MPFGESGKPPVYPVGRPLISMCQCGVESHLFFSLDLNDSAIVNHDFDGAITNTFDSLEKLCHHIRTGVATCCIFIFHRDSPYKVLNSDRDDVLCLANIYKECQQCT